MGRLTPPDVGHRLNEAGNTALKSPAIADRVKAEGGVVLGDTSSDFSGKLQLNNTKWATVIRDTGMEQE